MFLAVKYEDFILKEKENIVCGSFPFLSFFLQQLQLF